MTRTIDPEELAITAYHEAGHAVAYLAVGHRFRYVTIRPRTPGAAGYVAVRPRLVDAYRRAITIYAGPEAEARYLASLGWDEDEVEAAMLFGGCGDDFQAVERAQPDPGRRTAARQHAASLVDVCWPSVVAVAEQLLRQRRGLTYAEVSALMASPRNGTVTCN